jgi:hypothetical protein
MDNIVLKCRDLIGDIQVTTGRDTFEFVSATSSKIFTLSENNATSIVVYKNGILWPITPVAGSGGTWTRAATVVTITKTAHSLISGDVITVTASNSTAALPLASYTVTKITDNTFSVVGLNAGLTTGGTCTYTVIANYSYSASTGKITVTGTLSAGDDLEVTYSYYTKYSDTELQGYIRAAISYLAIEKYKCFVVKPPSLIFPTPTESEENIIAVIASILIKGDVVSYKTPEITITFERGDSKEKKIKKMIQMFSKSYGILDYIALDETTVSDEEED